MFLGALILLPLDHARQVAASDEGVQESCEGCQCGGAGVLVSPHIPGWAPEKMAQFSCFQSTEWRTAQRRGPVMWDVARGHVTDEMNEEQCGVFA